jgi:hypothetical protein
MKGLPEKIDRDTWQPVVVGDFDKFVADHPEVSIIDRYEDQIEELFLLRNPKYRFNTDYKDELEIFVKDHVNGLGLKDKGNWFFYPWLNNIIHLLPEEMYFEMRTGRNKNLITKEEQNSYYNSVVGILGLSVGSHVALTIAMTGGAKHFKIADPDTFSGSNLNRVRIGVQSMGLGKAVCSARMIYEINPYAQIKIYKEGLNEDNIEDFFSDPKLDILIEEMDNPFLKIKVRYLAKEMRIPTIMGTDNGDNVLVDIERYDMEPDLKILNGLIGDMKVEDLANFEPQDLPKIAAKIAGADVATVRMKQSVLEVGKSIYSWPQLGTAANLCGSSIAYLARRIINKSDNIKSGRYEVNLDSIFEDDYFSEEKEQYRKKETDEFFKKMNSQ